MAKKTAIVIGAGFAGLSAASELASKGFQVTLLEKHSTPGGRARAFQEDGFTFDMGPSWYWMPDVFDAYFARYNAKTADYYELMRLSPSYKVFWPEGHWDIPASMDELELLFESTQAGAGLQLRKFLADAQYKYEVAMKDLVFKPGLSILEFVDPRVLAGVFKLNLFKPISTHIRKYFKHPKLIELLEFPVLFLGAMPQETPALYSMMNYADMSLGTWYPNGGMGKIAEGMEKLAKKLGVTFQYNSDVTQIIVEDKRAVGVQVNNQEVRADVIVAAGDYHHMEQLLEPQQRNYDDNYWENRVMAPSCLLFYLGVKGRLSGLLHHNLFFDESFEKHAVEIYKTPDWPTAPLFYVCAPSISDSRVAPEGHENLFLLIPLAPGLSNDNEETREKYYEMMMDRIERRTNQAIRENVILKRSFCLSNFVDEYNAFKGNAYGLANTLMQTAILKPKVASKKTKGLFFAGQLTVPGPGVPPALISGKIAANLAIKSVLG